VTEPGPKVVVDASVVVKWMVREEGRDRALMLREAHLRGEVSLCAPDLLLYEVCNALRFCPDFTGEDVEAAAGALLGLSLRLSPPTLQMLGGAAREAFKYGVTVYDATYLSVAGAEGARLVTADKDFHGKLAGDPRVCLLSSEKFLDIFEHE